MADVKISQLPVHDAPTANDIIPIVTGGVTKKIAYNKLIPAPQPPSGGNTTGITLVTGDMQVTASGSGTESSPYTSSDGTAGIQAALNTVAQGRGGRVLLGAGRYDITRAAGIDITSASTILESIAAGFNGDPNGETEGLTGAKIRCSNHGIHVTTPNNRKGNIQLKHLYLRGTAGLLAPNASVGSTGIHIDGDVDQLKIEDVHLGGFDCGIRFNHFIDLSYFEKVNILNGRMGVVYDGYMTTPYGTAIFQKWNNCCFADLDGHCMLIIPGVQNYYAVISNCTFVHGCRVANVDSGANLYFGGSYSSIIGNQFYEAGKHLLNNQQFTADGMVLAGNSNTVTGNIFHQNQGGYGLRITGSDNYVSDNIFAGNSVGDILLTNSASNNSIVVRAGTVVTNQGSNNRVTYV